MVKLKNSGGWFKILSLSGDGKRGQVQIEILSHASPTVTPFSGCLEKLKRFGMKRFSQNTEFLLYPVVVLKTFAHKRGTFTNGII